MSFRFVGRVSSSREDTCCFGVSFRAPHHLNWGSFSTFAPIFFMRKVVSCPWWRFFIVKGCLYFYNYPLLLPPFHLLGFRSKCWREKSYSEERRGVSLEGIVFVRWFAAAFSHSTLHLSLVSFLFHFIFSVFWWRNKVGCWWFEYLPPFAHTIPPFWGGFLRYFLCLLPTGDSSFSGKPP